MIVSKSQNIICYCLNQTDGNEGLEITMAYQLITTKQKIKALSTWEDETYTISKKWKVEKVKVWQHCLDLQNHNRIRSIKLLSQLFKIIPLNMCCLYKKLG